MKITKTSRQVIEEKLLVALNDDSKVAVVCSKTELDILISALDLVLQIDSLSLSEYNQYKDFKIDLEKLREVLE